MGRTAIQPLLARQVADHHGVTVWSPDDIAGVPFADLQHLLGEGRQEWSGFTLRVGDRHLIVVNTAHSDRRQNSVIMHELAHISLGHELQSGTLSDQGFLLSAYDQDQEDEAAWLGATLLLPRPSPPVDAALWSVR
jgi:Zn-dependent peptidase ImmA (M78 family)